MKTILGTGQLGIAVMDALLKVNPLEQITLVNRTGFLEIRVPEQVKIVAADVTNENEMVKIARQSEVIFSCTDVPYQQWTAFYPATASALSHSLQLTNAKLVFADNLYSYGNVGGEMMHEMLPHNAQTKKGMVRADLINTFLNKKKELRSKVAIVKAADLLVQESIKEFLELISWIKSIAIKRHCSQEISNYHTHLLTSRILRGPWLMWETLLMHLAKFGMPPMQLL